MCLQTNGILLCFGNYIVIEVADTGALAVSIDATD